MNDRPSECEICGKALHKDGPWMRIVSCHRGQLAVVDLCNVCSKRPAGELIGMMTGQLVGWMEQMGPEQNNEKQIVEKDTDGGKWIIHEEEDD